MARKRLTVSSTFFSELYHFMAFKVRKPHMNLGSGMLIISIDVDVGCKELGAINQGRNDANVSRRFGECLIGEIEERALSIFVELFNDFEMPVTFAVRGQLTELNCLALDPLRESTIKHDIGAHGYYHRRFSSLSAEEAEEELTKIDVGMRRLGIIPRSFVFPRNDVAHLPLLERHGYKCYRGMGGFTKDAMAIDKEGTLFNVRPSLYIDQDSNHDIMEKILDLSVDRKLPLHVWFHLWNFGQREEQIRKCVNKVLIPLFAYAKTKVQRSELTFETMLSAACKMEKCLE